MALIFVRNDITKMQVDAIVNPANPKPKYSAGTDAAIYRAAGEEELLKARSEIGDLEVGSVAITPGFNLCAKYIVHAVSPLYMDGNYGEELKLRRCYRDSMLLAEKFGCKSIAFPLLASGSYGYPKDKGILVAMDEIASFLIEHDMQVYMVLFNQEAVDLVKRIYPVIEENIDQEYVVSKSAEEYGGKFSNFTDFDDPEADTYIHVRESLDKKLKEIEKAVSKKRTMSELDISADIQDVDTYYDKYGESADIELSEKLKKDKNFLKSYIIHLLKAKDMSKMELYTIAQIPRQTISKIWKDADYRPDKTTIIKICVAARLNLEETKYFLEKVGYSLSPYDKRDIIVSHFIEHQVYDVTKINEVLEQYDLPCLFREQSW